MASANRLRYDQRAARSLEVIENPDARRSPPPRTRTAPTSVRRAARSTNPLLTAPIQHDQMMVAPCLVVNSTMEPLQPLPVTHAIKLLLKGKAEIIEADCTTNVRAAHLTMHPPQIIRLMAYVKVPRHARKTVTNTWLHAHFNHTCTYCGRSEGQLGKREHLTRDHVIPLSRGGDHGWGNSVCSCSFCNQSKGSKTLTELGWTMRQAPSIPQFVHLGWTVRRLTAIQRQFVETYYGQHVARTLEHLLGPAAPIPAHNAPLDAAPDTMPLQAAG